MIVTDEEGEALAHFEEGIRISYRISWRQKEGVDSKLQLT